jgi:hypothetical protein
MEKTQNPLPQPKIDLKSTTGITDDKGNPMIFQEAFILRKVSKFLLPQSDVDGIIPIPVMVEINSGKLLLEMIPKEIRDEYKEVGI